MSENDEEQAFYAYDAPIGSGVIVVIGCACCALLAALAAILVTVAATTTRTAAAPCAAMQLTAGCCDIALPTCVMAVDLRLLGSPSPFGASASGTARYTLGACFAGAELDADVVALSSDAPTVPARTTTRVVLDSSGTFAVPVPAHATDLQVSVRLPSDARSQAAVGDGASMRFAPMRVDADNYRRRSALALYADNRRLLSQHLMLEYANRVAYDASGYDSTPVEGNAKPAGEQAGPHRSSRALAIVQIAVLDAMIAAGAAPYEPYALERLASPPADASIEAAIAAATYKTLVYLFPAQTARLTTLYADMIASIDDDIDEAVVLAGVEIGQLAAAAIIDERRDDGSAHREQNVGTGPNDYRIVDAPGEWSPDPISGFQVALGSRWAQLVRPFVLASADQFRAPPVDLAGAAYAASFNEVKAIGGDGRTTTTTRDSDQTDAAIYFAYDGSFVLCAPPRLYNQMLAQLAVENLDTPAEFARLLALGNIAMADAGIAAWESKWHYRLWRPVTGIRAPSTAASLVADPLWTPLGAPGSNGGIWFTPPFPAYPSGHATFGAAMAEVVRVLLGRDAVQFTFVSDELNGKTIGVDGERRPLRPRSFMSLTELELANAFSRMPLGIHWRIDATSGIEMGHRVAQQTLASAYRPAK